MAARDLSPAVQGSAPRLAIWGGCECTIRRVGDHFSDQLALSGHNARPDDLERLADLGLSALRYPLLWETFAAAPDPDCLWSWHTQRLERLRALSIKPIVGLVHHGSGPPHTNLLSTGFADGLAAHAEAAIARFPWICDWTPVNEPLTTARFSALYGLWYPHRRDERDFWLALFNQLEATRAAMTSVRRLNPGARLIQTEDLGHTYATEDLSAQAAFDNRRRWATWDILSGKLGPDHALWSHLRALGFERRLQSFCEEPSVPDVMGINHYLTSDRFLDHRLDLHPAASHGDSVQGRLADVEAVRMLDAPSGLAGAIEACWSRYHKPIALTEVHNGCTREEQMRWLVEAAEHARRAVDRGVGVEAVTVWSLFGAFDWDSLLTRQDGHYESGAFDVRSSPPRETALAPLVRDLAAARAPSHPVLNRAGWWRRHELVGDPCADSRPILICGATGTLGQAFAGACRLRGLEHVLAGRNLIEFGDGRGMRRTLDILQPWAVVNCAGWVRVDDAEDDPAGCMAANFFGCVDLATACEDRGIHFTCFSSDLVFDGDSCGPYTEDDVPRPLGVYGASKLEMERALEGSAALIVRTSSFFSPFDRHNFAMHLVESLRNSRPFAASSKCVTSPTFVPDLVRLTLDLIIDGEGGLWHLANDGSASWYDFALDLAGATGLRTDLVSARSEEELGWRAPRPRHAVLSSRRGQIMPTLASAVLRFAEHLPACPATSAHDGVPAPA